jgi:molecular chaperone DnaK
LILGIDLGTTKSVVGFWKNQRPFIIRDQAGQQSIPSVVLIDPEERIFVGNLARKHPERYKGKNITISSVKRLMGKKGETGWGWWKTYPQEVSAFILAELKCQAERYLGQEIEDAVIAVPSHFDESQRRATKEAAEIAGLRPHRFLNEATAPILAYGLRRRCDEKVLVFDLGGGTLDVSIAELGEGVYEVKCVEGDSRLGGDDFDQIIVDYILDKICQKFGAVVELDSFQNMMLKEAAELAKIELSGKVSASIHIPGFLCIGKSYHDLEVGIDRGTFEHLSKNLFDRAIEVLTKALDSASLRPSDLNALILVGGSSRIPYIRESIRRELGIEPFAALNPEICVAQGAIIWAAVLEGELKEVLLLDVIPNAYGIGLKGDVFSKLIDENTTVPTRRSQIFTTTEDNQLTIPITIYQGENEKASENTFLGTIELRDIPPAKAGVPQVEVTFDVDANQIVHVSAKDLGTNKEQSFVVKSPYGLNETQIRLMHQKLKSWLSWRQTLEIKRDTDVLRALIGEMLSTGAPALDQEEIQSLVETSASIEAVLAKGFPSDELESALSCARPIYEKARAKLVEYEGLIKETSIGWFSNHLTKKMRFY